MVVHAVVRVVDAAVLYDAAAAAKQVYRAPGAGLRGLVRRREHYRVVGLAHGDDAAAHYYLRAGEIGRVEPEHVPAAVFLELGLYRVEAYDRPGQYCKRYAFLHVDVAGYPNLPGPDRVLDNRVQPVLLLPELARAVTLHLRA